MSQMRTCLVLIALGLLCAVQAGCGTKPPTRKSIEDELRELRLVARGAAPVHAVAGQLGELHSIDVAQHTLDGLSVQCHCAPLEGW